MFLLSSDFALNLEGSKSGKIPASRRFLDDGWLVDFCGVTVSSTFLNLLQREIFVKVNSVQEACAKCFAVHILKFEILQITWKKWSKEYQTLSFQFFINKYSILMFLVLVLHVVYKISNCNLWTTKHLEQATCTELTLRDILKIGIPDFSAQDRISTKCF